MATATRAAESPAGGSIGLALGSGGAKGIAHVVVFEAIDELGLTPAIIAGASIGAVAGAMYGAGMRGRDMRAFLLDRIASPIGLVRDLLACRAGGLGDLFSLAGNPVLLNAELMIDRFLPSVVPPRFEDLAVPLLAVATDFYGRTELIFRAGPLRPALAASVAIPGVLRPVEAAGRLLIDGGVTNPLPFDLAMGRADIVIAVDVNGSPNPGERPGGFVPKPLDVLFASVQIMAHALIAEKLARARPAIVVAPAISQFRVFDFLKAEDILAAAAPAKEGLKRALDAALNRR